MPRKLRRKLLSFTKFKRPLAPESSPDDHQTHSTLVKRYNSLYHDDHNPTYNDSIPKPFGAYLNSRPSSSSSSSSSSSEPDFATIFASERFFFSSPGHSNSITEAAAVSSSSVPSSSRDGSRGSVAAVPTYSPDPYKDFRRSMEEMVEAYGLEDVHANWESLNELLTCYLALNPESTHGYIIAAFSDLLVGLLSASARRRRKAKAAAGGRDYVDGGG